jgi:hypothetical protein
MIEAVSDQSPEPETNMTLTSKQILSVTPCGAIHKGPTVRGLGFILPVTYALVNGAVLPGEVTAERKKDLPAALARAQRSATAGAMSADFFDGKFGGTQQKWLMGAGGMVPDPS